MTVKWLNFSNAFSALTLVIVASVLFVSCGHREPRSYDPESDGWIGVYVQDLDRDMRRYLNLDEMQGVLINDVVTDSPAEDAGLQAEDVIVEVDGRRIRDAEDLTRSIKRKRPGEKARIEVVRDDDRRTLTIRVEERPDERLTHYRRFDRRNHPRVFAFGQNRPRLGIKMTDLNEDLADYFQADAGDGVLVLSVSQDSPAEEAGIKAGDIILKIDGEAVRSSDELIGVLSEFDAGDEVEIEVKRRGETLRRRAELAEDTRRGFHFNHDFFNRDEEGWHERMEEWQRDMERPERRYRERAHEMESRLRERVHDRIHEKPAPLSDDLRTDLEALERDLEREIFSTDCPI